MTTPEQPNGPGLTRKQMREIRKTGATPVVTPEMLEEADASGSEAVPVEVPAPADVPAPQADDVRAEAEAAEVDHAEAETTDAVPVVPPAPEVAATAPPAVTPEPVVAPPLHLPRAAEPAVAAPAPPPDSQVDLGVSPLTRRQARAQERIRTASVPVITPEVAAAHAANPWAEPALPDVASPAGAEAPEDAAPEPVAETAVLEEVVEVAPVVEPEPVIEAELVTEPEPDPEPDPAAPAVAVAAVAAAEPRDAPEPEASVAAPADDPREAAADEAKPVLRPEFGSGLLAGTEGATAFAPSFDELITRSASSTGSLATPNALILSQVPSGSPLTSPVAATGEVLITGSLSLPEGLGSQGHAHGAADGKEIDSVLIDGELPAASSPTPIAASAAISTVKGTGEIIRPPAPEKGNKLMLGLGITAGVLAAALIGVLIFALATGVFS